MSSPKRLLALELRASRLGFVALESATELLDWGVRSSLEKESAAVVSMLVDRVATLLAFYKPDLVVVRIRPYRTAVQKRRFHALVEAVRRAAVRSPAKLYTLTGAQVERYFAASGFITKHAIATHLANEFPELTWKLPPKRKPYQNEAPAMLVFDALANGVAFLSRQLH